MKLLSTQDSGFTVVEVAGRLDAGCAADFEKQVNDFVAKGTKKVVMNLAELEYISSAGLRSLLALVKRLKADNGALSLCKLSGMVKEIITMSGFDSFIPIYDDLAAAKAAMK